MLNNLSERRWSMLSAEHLFAMFVSPSVTCIQLITLIMFSKGILFGFLIEAETWYSSDTQESWYYIKEQTLPEIRWYVEDAYRFREEDQNYPWWLVTIKGREGSQKESISSNQAFQSQHWTALLLDTGNVQLCEENNLLSHYLNSLKPRMLRVAMAIASKRV